MREDNQADKQTTRNKYKKTGLQRRKKTDLDWHKQGLVWHVYYPKVENPVESVLRFQSPKSRAVADQVLALSRSRYGSRIDPLTVRC